MVKGALDAILNRQSASNISLHQDNLDIRIPHNRVRKKVSGLEGVNVYSIEPELLKHPKIVSDSTASKASRAAKDNTARFFTQLYTALFREAGYEAGSIRDFTLLTGEKRRFQPDLVSKTFFGEKYIEVKATSARRAQTACYVEQAENYYHHLITGLIDSEEQRPVLRYAIFRYGDRKNLNLHKMNSRNAVRTLAKNVRDSLILSTNLALLLFALSRTEVREQQDKVSQEYIMLSGNLINLLHKPKTTRDGRLDIDWFLDSYQDVFERNIKTRKKQGKMSLYGEDLARERFETVKRFAHRKSIHLDDLKVEKLQSDRNGQLHYKDVVLPSFPVTVYSIRNYPIFLEDLKKYHKKNLEVSGIRDLYHEESLTRRKIELEHKKRKSQGLGGIPF